MLSISLPLLDYEENVSYNVSFLFTYIPIKGTIKYTIKQIYTHKKLNPICSKLIFKRFLVKLATEST